eukprot:g12295.t1
MEEMESRYHSMTCQAKSVYQLTCICGHDANDHSQIEKVEAGLEPGEGESDGIFLEDAGVWTVLQVLLRKDGPDPRNLQIKIHSCRCWRPKKAPKRLHCTARRWRGPMGGLWAELDPGHHSAGWVLLEGAPVELKLDGPLLQRASDG